MLFLSSLPFLSTCHSVIKDVRDQGYSIILPGGGGGGGGTNVQDKWMP